MVLKVTYTLPWASTRHIRGQRRLTQLSLTRFPSADRTDHHPTRRLPSPALTAGHCQHWPSDHEFLLLIKSHRISVLLCPPVSNIGQHLQSVSYHSSTFSTNTVKLSKNTFNASPKLLVAFSLLHIHRFLLSIQIIVCPLINPDAYYTFEMCLLRHWNTWHLIDICSITANDAKPLRVYSLGFPWISWHTYIQSSYAWHPSIAYFLVDINWMVLNIMHIEVHNY